VIYFVSVATPRDNRMSVHLLRQSQRSCKDVWMFYYNRYRTSRSTLYRA